VKHTVEINFLKGHLRCGMIQQGIKDYIGELPAGVDFDKLFRQAKRRWCMAFGEKIFHSISPTKLMAEIIGQNLPKL
jgi:hypothetical protein